MSIQAFENPQIFPHITELFIIQEGTELFLVTYPPIHVLIPGFVCVGGGFCIWGVGNEAARRL